MGRVWNRNGRKIQMDNKLLSRNWGFTRAYLLLFLSVFFSSVPCTLTLDLNFPLIEIRKIVQNIIYLLNMPPNNVTLFFQRFVDITQEKTA